MKNGRWPQKKWKWKTTSILKQSYWADFTTKTSKTNGFDTIEIDLVYLSFTLLHNIIKQDGAELCQAQVNLGLFEIQIYKLYLILAWMKGLWE